MAARERISAPVPPAPAPPNAVDANTVDGIEEGLMGPDTDAKTIASRCLAAWSSGDLTTTRALLDDNVIFAGPMGATEGTDAYMEGIQGMVRIVDKVEQHLVFGEGGNVCVIYDLV